MAYRDHRAHDAAEIFARIRAGGGQAVAVEADLSDPAAPAALFDAAEQQLGPVDILVNNATGASPRTWSTRRSPTPAESATPFAKPSPPARR